MSAAFDPQLLDDTVAIVTGSGQGIGLAIACELAAVGAHVALFDSNEARLLSAVDEVERAASGGRVHAAVVDVTDIDRVGQAVADVGAELGAVTVLVNNAGILRDASLRKMTHQQFDEVINVHLRGTFTCTKACLESMVAAGGGAIVSMSSSTGLYGNPGQTNYGAAKAGIIGMTRTWAVELARYGIRVNAIAPGAIDTPMMRSVGDALLQHFTSLIPLGRLGEPREVARLATFLASPLASYITGQVILIDGGSTVAG